MAVSFHVGKNEDWEYVAGSNEMLYLRSKNDVAVVPGALHSLPVVPVRAETQVYNLSNIPLNLLDNYIHNRIYNMSKIPHLLDKSVYNQSKISYDEFKLLRRRNNLLTNPDLYSTYSLTKDTFKAFLVVLLIAILILIGYSCIKCLYYNCCTRRRRRPQAVIELAPLLRRNPRTLKQYCLRKVYKHLKSPKLLSIRRLKNRIPFTLFNELLRIYHDKNQTKLEL